MYTNRLFRRGGFAKTLRVVSVGSLASYQAISSPPIRKNDDQPSCNTVDQENLLHYSAQALSSLLSNVALSLEENRTSLDENIKADKLALTSLHKRKTCLQSAVNGNIINEIYDFVIIGYGNTGQSALRTLRKECPHARIALVDPLRSSKRGRKKSSKSSTNIEHYRDTVVEFDTSKKSVKLLTDQNTHIVYRHGLMIATGARGAPPPLELFQEASLSRVLELRPTELSKNTKRPMMAPEKARKAVAEAASRGAKIAILGSGWEALDLLLVAERACKSMKKKPPTICYGNQGIAWNILPSYLSTELRKKLSKRGIDLQDRSYVRYVANFQQQDNNTNCQQLELHTAKTYDLLDTRRTILDLLVVAPDSFGDKGTAALPTPDIPDRMKESSDGRPWYKTWSQMSKTSNSQSSKVICFEDDGRVSVNAELSVASRIYAAGSCAKYPNSSTGHSSIAGEGSIDGTEAGRIAALNMSREYRQISRAESYSFVSSLSEPVEEAHSFATNSFPVWRSDITSYPAANGDRTSALSNIGVQALCVGKCDSERQATRAFWWTNSSARRKMKRFIKEQAEDVKEVIKNSDDEDDDDDDDNDDFDGVDGYTSGEDSNTSTDTNNKRDEIAISRRKSVLISRNKTRGNPIYGIGVVFYLDNYGKLQGIMTWGLPFADRPGDSINPELLEHIKHLIATNAGISAQDAEEKHQLMNAALGRASQKLVALAVKGHVSHMTRAWHGLDGPIEDFTTPLYRYTEVSNSKNKTVNVLKRKDGSGLGVLGEGLYVRDDFIMEEALANDPDISDSPKEISEEPPSNIPATMYPISILPVTSLDSDKAISADTAKELNRFLMVQRRWETNENRARPGKEDPLWLRPGDEKRNTSGKQTLIDAYRRIMFPHRSG